MGTLNMRAVLAVVLACCAAVGAQNVVCKKGTSSNTVTIEDGKGYTFKTQKGKKYLGNTNCAVEYKMGSTCTKMSFVCTKFNTNNRDKKRCKKGDKMTITVGSKARVYCKTKKPRVSSAGDIKVVFYSDKRGSASGAICKVRCTEAATSSTGRKRRRSLVCGEEKLKSLFTSIGFFNLTLLIQCCDGTAGGKLTTCGPRQPCEEACGKVSVVEVITSGKELARGAK